MSASADYSLSVKQQQLPEQVVLQRYVSAGEADRLGHRLRGVTPLNVDHGVVGFRDDVDLG